MARKLEVVAYGKPVDLWAVYFEDMDSAEGKTREIALRKAERYALALLKAVRKEQSKKGGK